MLTVDPALFDPSAVTEEIARQNAEIVAKLEALPASGLFPPALIRERRRQGLGPFPEMPRSARARVRSTSRALPAPVA